MGGFLIILARALIVSPVLIGAVLSGLDHASASAAFAKSYPALAAAYPFLLGGQAILGAVIVLGLPLHRTLSVLLGVVVVALALWKAPFWNFMGAEKALYTQLFFGLLAQTGGLLLIAAMPGR